jgi:hypothetical protein
VVFIKRVLALGINAMSVLKMIRGRRAKPTPKTGPDRARRHFCGECLREIGGHWVATVHLEDGTPICKARPVKLLNGTPLTFEADHETNRIIEESGLDPRVREYWEHFPAADGSRPYKKWIGKK